MSNPMDDITRLEVHPDDCQEVRDLIGEINLIFAKFKELFEMQEKNLDIDLLPTMWRLIARTGQIVKGTSSNEGDNR